MAYSYHKLLFLLFAIFFSHTFIHSSNGYKEYHSSMRYFCRTTPYQQVCYSSLSKSVSIHTSSNTKSYLLQTLHGAISETTNMLNLFNNVGPSNIIEKQRGALQDCRELHQSTLASLNRSLSGISSSSININDAKTYLSAALTNKNTCLEGLDSASGTMKPSLVKSVVDTYKHVSNSLSILSNPMIGTPEKQSLMADPTWSSSSDQSSVHSDGEEYHPNEVIVVAADGTGKFTTISEAINFAPNNSRYKTVIHVKEGVYGENVEIPSSKTNIVMIGDGNDVTVITGNRSVGGGWTTFNSAILFRILFSLLLYILGTLLNN